MSWSNTFKCVTSKYLSNYREMDFPGDGWLQWSWLASLCFAYFRFIWNFKQFWAFLAIIKLVLLFTSFSYLINFIHSIPTWMLRILWQRKREVRSNWLVQSLIATGTKNEISWLLVSFLILTWLIPGLLLIPDNDIFFQTTPPSQPMH